MRGSKSWFQQHRKDNYKAVCKLCNDKDFSIGKMDVLALVWHMNDKHQKSIMKDKKSITVFVFCLFFKSNKSEQVRLNLQQKKIHPNNPVGIYLLKVNK